jgi:hypothetical protein
MMMEARKDIANFIEDRGMFCPNLGRFKDLNKYVPSDGYSEYVI